MILWVTQGPDNGASASPAPAAHGRVAHPVHSANGAHAHRDKPATMAPSRSRPETDHRAALSHSFANAYNPSPPMDFLAPWILMKNLIFSHANSTPCRLGFRPSPPWPLQRSAMDRSTFLFSVTSSAGQLWPVEAKFGQPRLAKAVLMGVCGVCVCVCVCVGVVGGVGEMGVGNIGPSKFIPTAT